MAAPTPTYAYQSEAQRSFTTPQDYYRLRDFGQKFEATIAFLRKHGGNLYRVLLVPMLLALVPIGLIAVLFSSNISQMGAGANSWAVTMVPALFGLCVFILAAMMAQYVMIYGFVKCRMHQPDPSVQLTAGEVWQEGRRHILPLLGYYLVGVVLMLIGFVLLVVPGIYLMVVLLLLPCVVVFEDVDMGSSFSRSLSLIRGKWWSTFGLYFVAGMAIGMVAGGLGAIITLATTLFSLKDGDSSAALVGLAAAQALQMGINFLLYPVLFVLLMFQYFNLVERRDHVSLQWRAEQLGQTPADPHGPAGSAHDDLFRPSYGDQAL